SLGPGFTPALTKGESLCHPAGSSFHTLVASSQGGASIPGAALCRHPSEVRAVCGNSARTDPCGGCEATRIPTATSPFVVNQARFHEARQGRKTNVGQVGNLRGGWLPPPVHREGGRGRLPIGRRLPTCPTKSRPP